MVAVGRAFNAAQGLGGGSHGRVKTKAAFAVGNVVVNGLGHTHALHANGMGQAIGQALRAVTANGHHHVQTQRLHIALDLGQCFLVLERVGAVAGAQNGASNVQDA